jgi:hypothetical protein
MPKQTVHGGLKVIGDIEASGIVTGKSRVISLGGRETITGTDACAFDITADDNGAIIILTQDDVPASALDANAYALTLNADTQQVGWRCTILVAKTVKATTKVTAPSGAVLEGFVLIHDTDSDATTNASSDATDTILSFNTAEPGTRIEIIYVGKVYEAGGGTPVLTSTYLVSGNVLETVPSAAFS